MIMANCKKQLPQEGTDLNEVRESLSASALSPSYSGGGNNRYESSQDREMIEAVLIVSDGDMTDYAIDEDVVGGSVNQVANSGTVSMVRPDSAASYTFEGSTDRKRALCSSLISTDNEEDDTAPRKVSKARRGRGRSSLSGIARAMEDLAKPSAETYRLDKDEAEPKTTKVKPVKKKVYAQFEGDSFNVDELESRVIEELDTIQEASRKSKNLKGTVQSTINQSLIIVRGIVDSLKKRTVDDETKRLRADNDRLSRELTILKTELRALRRDYDEKNARSNASSTAGPAPPSSSAGVDVEEVVRRVTVSVGEMVNARIAGIEDRLLPPKTIRPPLAANKKKMSPVVPARPEVPILSSGSATGKKASFAKAAATPAVSAASRMHRQAGTPAGPDNSGSTDDGSQPSTQQTAATAADDDEGGWTTHKKKKKSHKKKQAAPATSQMGQPKPKKPAVVSPKAKKQRKHNFSLPKSAAVVITIQPEALERGVTYTEVLTKAKAAINLAELGIEGVRSRQSAAGARILELPGASSGPKADLLAEKLQSTLADVARVARPVKCVDLRVSGLDDSVCKEDIVTAIVDKVECSREHIQTGEIRMGPGGSGVVNVQCPVAAAKALIAKGRLLVGWSSAQVSTMDSRPLRCFRCMGVGHTRPRCISATDRGDLCFRCGKAGHRSATCTSIPKCAVCADAKRPAGHVMGGRRCNPPASKGKSVFTPRSAAPPTMSSNVPEEVVMSD